MPPAQVCAAAPAAPAGGAYGGICGARLLARGVCQPAGAAATPTGDSAARCLSLLSHRCMQLQLQSRAAPPSIRIHQQVDKPITLQPLCRTLSACTATAWRCRSWQGGWARSPPTSCPCCTRQQRCIWRRRG